MKYLLSTVALSLALSSTAFAAGTTATSTSTDAPKAEHHSLKHCEKEATSKNLKGDERAKFVKECQGKK